MGITAVENDLQGFRQALAGFASTVNVITMHDDLGNPIGMTATAFSSVSAEPPLILVCINRSNRSFEHVSRDGRFGVNMLTAQAREVSEFCARGGADKTLPAAWLDDAPVWGSPALRGSLVFLDCEIEQEIHAGTHAILIGAVRGIGLSDGPSEPLVYFQGKYRPLHELADIPLPKRLPILDDASA